MLSVCTLRFNCCCVLTPFTDAWFFDGTDCAGRDRGYTFDGVDDQEYGRFDAPVDQGGDGSDPKSVCVLEDRLCSS